MRLLLSFLLVIITTNIHLAQNQNEIFSVVEEMPRFPGFEDIQDNVKRKKAAIKAMHTFIFNNLKPPKQEMVESRLLIEFIVMEDGSLEEIKVLNSVSKAWKMEAIRLIKSMPNWIPGRMRGRAVKVKYRLPINCIKTQ